jgi:DNA-binding response OmpR family regulator
MDGHTLARESKRKRPDLKVLILFVARRSDFPEGADGHDRTLVKPVSPQIIVSKVEELLRERGDDTRSDSLAPSLTLFSKRSFSILGARTMRKPCHAMECLLETRREIKVSEVLAVVEF